MAFWNTFTAAPHRMMMFGGTLQLAIALLFWTAALAARHAGLDLRMEALLPGLWSHGYLMLYGLFACGHLPLPPSQLLQNATNRVTGARATTPGAPPTYHSLERCRRRNGCSAGVG